MTKNRLKTYTLCLVVFLWLWAPDCAHAMEPYTPELVDIEENIEIVLVEEAAGIPAEEERRRQELIAVVDSEIAYAVVIGTVILFVFTVAHLIPSTN